jgi:hypothetical protein
MTPAAPKAMNEITGADDTSVRSWVAAVKIPSPATATRRRAKTVL